MRRIVFYILPIVFMLNFGTVSSQIIVDTMVCDYQSKNYKCYTIANNTNENYLTWVSSYDIQGKSEKELYREYFIRRVKREYSLFDLMIEETISDELYDIVGFSFLKLIPPFSEFMYCIQINDAAVYLDNIIVTKQDSVYKYIAMSIPQKFYYTCDTIYVNDSNRRFEYIDNGNKQFYEILSDKMKTVALGRGDKTYRMMRDFVVPSKIMYKDNVYTVTEIGKSAFIYCDSLSDITLPKSLEVIGAYAFYACSTLERLVIPSSVSYIDQCVFSNCSNLRSIIIESDIPPGIHENAFYELNTKDLKVSLIENRFIIYVPNESLELYKTHELWGQMDIKPMSDFKQ